MSLESVRAFFAERAPDIPVIESEMSSATVALAAEAYGVEPARIAKTLQVSDRVVLIVAAGTARMDNKKSRYRSANDLLPAVRPDRASGCFRRDVAAGRFGIRLEHRLA